MTNEQINEILSLSEWLKRQLIKQGLFLDVLITDPNLFIRRIVAKYGSPDHLNLLLYDTSLSVRAEVAKRGNPEHLALLINDKSYLVRLEVAYLGNPEQLNRLLNDPNPWVREVARRKIKKGETK